MIRFIIYYTAVCIVVKMYAEVHTQAVFAVARPLPYLPV